MSKFSNKYNFSAKGILYIENGALCIENENTGELVNIAEMLKDFHQKECTLSVAYSEEIE